MVRWSKAPRCWDEFKCNIWVNSWFRPPTECLGRERYIFGSKKERDVLWKMMVKATFGLERWSFFFGGWIYLYRFFLSLRKKVQHLSRPCWSNQRSTPPRNGWSEAPEGSEKSCYFATFSPAASSCAPAMVRVFGDCAANTRPVLTKGLFSSAAWVTMKWEPYLGLFS